MVPLFRLSFNLQALKVIAFQLLSGSTAIKALSEDAGYMALSNLSSFVQRLSSLLVDGGLCIMTFCRKPFFQMIVASIS